MDSCIWFVMEIDEYNCLDMHLHVHRVHRIAVHDCMPQEHLSLHICRPTNNKSGSISKAIDPFDIYSCYSEIIMCFIVDVVTLSI